MRVVSEVNETIEIFEVVKVKEASQLSRVIEAAGEVKKLGILILLVCIEMPLAIRMKLPGRRIRDQSPSIDRNILMTSPYGSPMASLNIPSKSTDVPCG